MRLIDADALMELYADTEGIHFAVYNVPIPVVRQNILDMPTIEAEPVRHGRWAYIGGDEWCCTNCGEVISTEGRWERPSYNYCHECGAKMDALTFEEASRKLGRQAAETLRKLKEEGHDTQG